MLCSRVFYILPSQRFKLSMDSLMVLSFTSFAQEHTKSHKWHAYNFVLLSSSCESNLVVLKVPLPSSPLMITLYNETFFSLLTPPLSSSFLYSYRSHYITTVLPLSFELLSPSCQNLLKWSQRFIWGFSIFYKHTQTHTTQCIWKLHLASLYAIKRCLLTVFLSQA